LGHHFKVTKVLTWHLRSLSCPHSHAIAERGGSRVKQTVATQTTTIAILTQSPLISKANGWKFCGWGEELYGIAGLAWWFA